jgi:Zn-dependent peptidase ImmA (M78 family)/transcriptional regulator with XRE-family HTH domain
MSAMPNRRALKAVRQQRGLDIAQVAEFAAISLDRLNDFELGEREPSRKQLERLAETYGVPLYSLFGDAVPNLPPLPQDFRKADPAPASLSPRGMRALLSTERISLFTKQVGVEVNYKPVDLSQAAHRTAPAKTRATRLRAAFDTWLTPRDTRLGFSGSPEQKFMSALRLFFEIQGGVVNVNDAPANDYMGFFIKPESGFPSIFVNRSVSSKKAQLFTLAHEYSHALLGQDGISNPFSPRNAVERSCNIFAAEFLAPMEDFARIVEGLPRATRSDVGRFIDAASSRTLLSKHAAAIRLIEGEYISQRDFRAWRAIFASNPRAEKDEEKEASSAAGGAPHAKRLSEIGNLAVFLAKDSFDVADSLSLSRPLQERAYALAAKRFEIALS